ncbi:hypothetical protein HK102_012327, partial [Quaeritorhiza haematococci]
MMLLRLRGTNKLNLTDNLAYTSHPHPHQHQHPRNGDPKSQAGKDFTLHVQQQQQDEKEEEAVAEGNRNRYPHLISYGYIPSNLQLDSHSRIQSKSESESESETQTRPRWPWPYILMTAVENTVPIRDAIPVLNASRLSLNYSHDANGCGGAELGRWNHVIRWLARELWRLHHLPGLDEPDAEEYHRI